MNTDPNLHEVECTPVMLLGNIWPQNGGVTHAVYRRANALSERFGRVVIATSMYDPNFASNREWHYSRGSISPKVELWNLYDDFSGEIADPRSHVKHARRPEWSYFQDSKNPDAYRVFDADGCYARYEEWGSTDKLKFVDHFEAPWTRVAKTVFDEFGAKRRLLRMGIHNRPEFQVTYDPSARPVVSSRLDQKGTPVNYFCHPLGVEFYSEIEMVVAWLAKRVETLFNPVVFSEKREYADAFRYLDEVNVHKIFCLHSSHLDAPFDDSSVLSPSIDSAFTAVKEGSFDRLVVLTDSQKEDLSFDPELHSRTRVISHYQDRVSAPAVSRDDRLIVSLARYHSAKDLSSALRIFAKVVGVLPDVRYEIYGYGPERSKLEELIGQLGIVNEVSLMGHTDTPEYQLKRARVSLLTSKHEGFGLALTESLAMGTPVVSFDTKYGPRDIVRDGFDGFVVGGLNRESVASDRLIELLTNDELWQSFSIEALGVSDRFSRDVFCALWQEQIEALFMPAGS